MIRLERIWLSFKVILLKTMSLKIRKAARTVIFDADGKTAVISVNDGEYFKIPGGGIEPGQTTSQAAQAEARQEAGCLVRLLRRIGTHSYVNANTETEHQSVCYLASKVGESQETQFTIFEKENKFKLLWLTATEAISLFEGAKPTEEITREINKRDLNFLIIGYKAWIKGR